MGDPVTLALVVSALLVGTVSALTPVLPAEVYVLTVAATQPTGTGVAVALGAAAGQTVGKVVIFTAVRGARTAHPPRWLVPLVHRAEHGAADLPEPSEATADAVPREFPLPRAWSRTRRGVEVAGRTAARWLSGRWGPWVVVLSGAVSMPPLLPLAAAAGLSRMPLHRFAIACLAGRAVRFTALVLLPGAAVALV